MTSDKSHNQKLEEKREQKKKKDQEQTPIEKREVVMHGAALKCQYAKGSGKLVVTSNEILLQDQKWATVNDDSNMVNLQFKGTCGHPKWPNQKMPPPPCMSVIKLSPWQKIGTTIVQEQTVLVKESFINCEPDFNSAVAKPISKVASIATKKNKIPVIIDSYWVNKSFKKIKLMPYGDNNLRLLLKTNIDAVGKKIKIFIYDQDSISDDYIIDKVFIIDSESSTISIPLTGELFSKGGDSILNLYVKINLENDRYKFPKANNDYLKIHVVQFVPIIEGNLGWAKAKMVQDIWFNGQSNAKPWAVNPKVGLLTMDWILGFDRMKNLYNDIIKDKWKSDNAIVLLKKRIKEMSAHKLLILPKINNQSVNFGVIDDSIRSAPDIEQPKLNNKKETELMPFFERYYHQSISYNISKNIFSIEPLDDIFGTLASCQFRVIALGKITRIDKELKLPFGNTIKSSHYLVEVNKIGVYVKDSFDFISQDEYLGDWSPKKNAVRINPYGPDLAGEYEINNASYRAWRVDYGKGMDFNLYSDIKFSNVKHVFNAEIKELDL